MGLFKRTLSDIQRYTLYFFADMYGGGLYEKKYQDEKSENETIQILRDYQKDLELSDLEVQYIISPDFNIRLSDLFVHLRNIKDSSIIDSFLYTCIILVDINYTDSSGRDFFRMMKELGYNEDEAKEKLRSISFKYDKHFFDIEELPINIHLEHPTVIKSWPLLTFAKAHGKMQVGEFVNKETGELFKSCIFTKPDGTRTFVAFSAKLGVLTPKEIAAMKDELVVKYDNGNYSLCKIEDRKCDDVCCGSKVEDSQTVRKNWDNIYDWKGKYAVGIKDGKKGAVNKDGITVIEPIFDEIEHESFNEMIAYNNNSPISYRILLGTFGEGLVCVEEFNGNKRINLAFVNKDLKKKIVFDEKWKKENGLELSQINIPFYSSCHFEKGILRIDFPIDEYYGRIYEIDKHGNARDVGGIDYKEFRNVDPLEDIDWNFN